MNQEQIAAARAYRQADEEARLRLLSEFETWRPTPLQSEVDRMAAGDIVMLKIWDLSPLEDPNAEEPPGRPGAGPDDPPYNYTRPALTGTPEVGEELTVDNGRWSEPTPTYARVWQRDGTTIGGQTGLTYTLIAADAGHAISVVVTATNPNGSTPATSNTLTIAADPDAPPVVVTNPAITPTTAPRVNETLTTTNGTWNPNTGVTFTRVWKRGAATIPGATGLTYQVQAADVGTAISVTVTAENTANGESTDANSNVLPNAIPLAPTNDTAPAITPTTQPRVGQALDCDSGAWSPAAPVPNYTYAWHDQDGPIGGATSEAYTPTAAEVGKTLHCTVTATTTGGVVSHDSNTTLAVLPLAPTIQTPPAVTPAGTAIVGATLTCSNNGTWTPTTPTPTYAHSWHRDGAAINPAQTGLTYILAAADADTEVSCVVTASNDGGSGAPSESNLVAVTATAAQQRPK
jgi:hypothetical protein